MEHAIKNPGRAVKLIDATKKLLREKWSQDGPIANNRGYDLTGALYSASLVTPGIAFVSHNEVLDELHYRLGSFPGGLVAWNNSPERTLEEVIALLDTLLKDISDQKDRPDDLDSEN